MVIQGKEFGTVSSTLLALSRKIQHAVMQYSPGPPGDHAYDDLSALLRQVLSAERSRKNREAEKAAREKARQHEATAVKEKVKKK